MEAAIPVDVRGQQRIVDEISSFPGKLHPGVRPDVGTMYRDGTVASLVGAAQANHEQISVQIRHVVQ